MGNHKESQRKATLHFYIRVFTVACLGFILSMTSVHASSDSKLEKIYHVYVENEYIGKVDDKSVVQQVATKKLDKLNDKYKDLNLVIGESIDRKSTRLNSSHVAISYAVFCLKKKKITTREQQ